MLLSSLSPLSSEGRGDDVGRGEEGRGEEGRGDEGRGDEGRGGTADCWFNGRPCMGPNGQGLDGRLIVPDGRWLV